MTRVVVVGYASLDHAMEVDALPGPDTTTLVSRRLSPEWPRSGGVAHHLRALRAADPGLEVDVVSWVGPDTGGRAWVDAVRAAGAEARGVVSTGTRSPSSYLLYGPTGTACVYDPADCHAAGALDATQLDLVARADWCLLAVAPRWATEQALGALRPGARLAWAVKHDDDAYPPGLVAALLDRADVVSLSAGERTFLAADGAGPERRVRPGAVVAETQGAHGVLGHVGDTTVHVPVRRAVATDPTGAGDTFIATLVAHLAAGPLPTTAHAVRPALERAAAAATDLVASRATDHPAAGGTAPTAAQSKE